MQDLEDIGDSLKDERVMLLNTMEFLLQHMVTEEELVDLVDDVGGSAWSRSDFEEELKRRLVGSYQHFCDKLAKMSSWTKDLQTKIQAIEGKACSRLKDVIEVVADESV